MSHFGFSRREVLFLGLAAGASASQAPFWDTRPAADWSPSELYQVLNHSPWAKPVRGFWPPAYQLPDLAPIHRGDFPSAPATARPAPDGIVTWESSLAIRDAVRTPLPEAFRDCYVLGVDGIPLEGRPLESARKTALLHLTGRPKRTLHAELAGELRRNSTVYAFGFPRSGAPIQLSDGEIQFTVTFTSWLIEARFALGSMTYRGQLAV